MTDDFSRSAVNSLKFTHNNSKEKKKGSVFLKKKGQTIFLDTKPKIISTAAIVGNKEGEGPIAHCFDKVVKDSLWGEESWEKAESKFLEETAKTAIKKANLVPNDIDFMYGGDLLNQCISANYAARTLGIPFFGLYGACSTMSLSMLLSSIAVSSGYAKTCAAITSSHFCSAEKQFRFPLEYGGQRTPTAQWTVTGSGYAIISSDGEGPQIREMTAGKVTDFGITDLNNMGAAMAPAACDTLCAHFNDTGKTPDDYDLILTGDLGQVGKDILEELMKNNGFDIRKNHNDCGLMIFDNDTQDTHAGGSGCGCSASVFCGYIAPLLKQKRLKNVLFMATGALMSPTSVQQGESIPGIAHALAIYS